MEIDKIIKEQVETAPPEIKKILVEGHWAAVVKEIAQKNNLSNEQIGFLENETLFILLGMELPSSFSENLKTNIGLEQTKAFEINKEVSEKIFKEIEHLLPTEVEVATPELKPENLPMVEKGETAHTVEPLTHNQQPTTDSRPQITTNTQIPKEEKIPSQNAYVGGQDPYREPLT